MRLEVIWVESSLDSSASHISEPCSSDDESSTSNHEHLLARCDISERLQKCGLGPGGIINKGIDDEVGRKIVLNMMDAYMKDDEYNVVHAFNKEPETFDFDDFLARQNEKWQRVEGGGGDSPGTSSSKRV